jgi:hypothetical protein
MKHDLTVSCYFPGGGEVEHGSAVPPVSPLSDVQLYMEILGSEAVSVLAKLNIFYVYFTLDVFSFIYSSFRDP